MKKGAVVLAIIGLILFFDFNSNSADYRMKHSDFQEFLMSITYEQMVEAWKKFDTRDSGLSEFIAKYKIASIAGDAAANAMKKGDAEGRATWSGFLRALYILGSISEKQSGH
jgi:hypothetical protein